MPDADPPTKKACCTPQRDSTSPTQPAASAGFVAGAYAQDGRVVPLAQAGENIAYADSGSSDGMAKLAGGTFLMGNDDPDAYPMDGEGPVREVTLDPFYIDTCCVTNAQFTAFVDATGYETLAERFGWSFVFQGHLPSKYLQRLRTGKIAGGGPVPGVDWWLAVPGAMWRRPLGERSSIKDKQDHPVVQVGWADAIAYCRWAGKRLPTEAQWAFAARGDKVQTRFPWGEALEPRGAHRCNVFQGSFPDRDTAGDGYACTCPVDTYPPNAFGLYNMVGNVWEWCADWFSPDWHIPNTPKTRDNPTGPDDAQAGLTHKVQKGGSYLCHDSYCNRYRLGSRTGNTPDSATTNSGFRCVMDVQKGES